MLERPTMQWVLLGPVFSRSVLSQCSLAVFSVASMRVTGTLVELSYIVASSERLSDKCSNSKTLRSDRRPATTASLQ